MTNKFNIEVGEQYFYRGDTYLVIDTRRDYVRLRSAQDSTHIICISRERLAYAHGQGQFYKAGRDATYDPPCLPRRGVKLLGQCANSYGGLTPSYQVDNGAEFTRNRVISLATDLGAGVVAYQPPAPADKALVEYFFCTLSRSNRKAKSAWG